MILIKNWRKINYKKHTTNYYFGVFLFGIIPLFIKVKTAY